MRVRCNALFCLFFSLVVLLSSPVLAASEQDDRQGWSAKDRAWWYSISQGSHLLPWKWMQVLEQPGSTDKFLAPAHMSSLGYLQNPYATEDNLPIGFVIDQPEPSTLYRKICRFFGLSCGLGGEQAWLGLNCSACHTSQVSYGGKTIRIDGGQTLADFQTFEARLLQALKETRQTPDKWARFFEALGIAKDDIGALDKLGKAFDAQIDWYEKLDKKNYAPLRYGPGRLDAQGHILNKVSLRIGVTDQLTDFPSDAPASYPFIWNVPQQDFIQWNGIVKNQANPITIRGEPTDFGAIGRNVGEVLGVFGEIDTSTDLSGYESSVRLDNLILIERQLKRLQSPRWPAEFPPVDKAMRDKGEALYKGKCEGCHSIIAPDDLSTKIKAVMLPVTVTDPDKQTTDIWLACNTFLHRSKSGLLEGRKLNVYTGDVIQPVDGTARLLTNAVTGTIIGRGDEVVERFIKDTFRGPIFGDEELARAAPPRPMVVLPGITDEVKRQRATACLTQSDDFLRYKGRPLNGIWATAPYLHNGSVPTLYDLLLPSRMRQTARQGSPEPVITGPVRPDSFKIGTHEFDPKKVGYVSDGDFEFRTHDEAGVPLLGNYNSGHDYGNGALTEDERWALVEYLKDL